MSSSKPLRFILALDKKSGGWVLKCSPVHLCVAVSTQIQPSFSKVVSYFSVSPRLSASGGLDGPRGSCYFEHELKASEEGL